MIQAQHRMHVWMIWVTLIDKLRGLCPSILGGPFVGPSDGHSLTSLRRSQISDMKICFVTWTGRRFLRWKPPWKLGAARLLPWCLKITKKPGNKRCRLPFLRLRRLLRYSKESNKGCFTKKFGIHIGTCPNFEVVWKKSSQKRSFNAFVFPAKRPKFWWKDLEDEEGAILCGWLQQSCFKGCPVGNTWNRNLNITRQHIFL